MTQLASPRSDGVSEVLRTFAVRSTIFCRSELRAPWAFRVEGESVAKFHLVLEGSALLQCGSGAVALAAGDLVVLPRGAEHTLADDPGSQAAPLEQLLAEHGVDGGSRLRYGEDGSLTRLLCGGFSLAEGITDSTLAHLPDVLHMAFDPGAVPWLEPVLAAFDRGSVGWAARRERDRREDHRRLPRADAANMAARGGAGRDRPRRADDPGRFDRQGCAHAQQQPVGAVVARPAREVTSGFRAPRSRRDSGNGSASRPCATSPSCDCGGQPKSSRPAGRRSVRSRRAGYDSDAAFAKAFKRRFGLSPRAYGRIAKEPPRVEVAAPR